MRTTKETRDKLEAAANTSGRSLAQEVEYRLERSFLEEDALYREIGGKEFYDLMRWLSLTFKYVEQSTKKSWIDDLDTLLIGLEASKTFFSKGVPQEEAPSEEFVQDMGKEIADWMDKSRKKDRK